MKKLRASRLILHFYLLLFTLLSVSPLVLLFMNGLKPKTERMTSPFTPPVEPTFDSIIEAWDRGGYLMGYINNTVVGAASILIIIVAASAGAYALSKLDFKGKGLYLVLLFVIIAVPMGVYLVPIFFLYANIGLMDTIVGIIIIYSGVFLPFVTFLFRTYFIGIPVEISESAFIDGLNHFQIYSRVILPISKPMIVTSAVILGLWTWNEFFFSNALLQSHDTRTVASRYFAFVGTFTADWNLIAAAGIITIVPVIVAYAFLQDKFVSGITEGSLKG